jgi:hypothetical protein
MPMVLILAGATGAGKSTFATKLSSAVENHAKKFAQSIGIVPSKNSAIFSADHFFTQPDGQYNFDCKKLPEAHAECMKNFLYTAMYCSIKRTGTVIPTSNRFFDQVNFSKQSNPVISEPDLLIVDNTNTNIQDVSPYIHATQALGLSYKILVFDTHINRSVHNVPLKAIENMRTACRKWTSQPPRSFFTEKEQLLIIGTNNGYRLLLNK